MNVRIIHGDCREMLPTLTAGLVQCCVTSPPYFGLRDYGVNGQIGLEPTPDEYVGALVEVFREVRRVMADDGTCWLNIGDSFANDAKWGGSTGGKHVGGKEGTEGYRLRRVTGLKSKDLMMVPARVAIALQADGWYLRSDIIWAKPNPMPESVTDRPTSSHEHVFLLTKRERYFYDAEAIAEVSEPSSLLRLAQNVANQVGSARANGGAKINGNMKAVGAETRNARNVWTIATQPFSGAHFATMPPELAERCIRAGSRPGDTILDPFSGAGTTALVADRLGRHAIGIELNPDYAAMGRSRVEGDAPLFAEVSA